MTSQVTSSLVEEMAKLILSEGVDIRSSGAKELHYSQETLGRLFELAWMIRFPEYKGATSYIRA
jgi:hypothetical protein